MNLTPEQLAYLKSLESPKKRRKFMLDCLVENALGESVKFEEEINRLNVSYQTSTAPETLKHTIVSKSPHYEVKDNAIFVSKDSPMYDFLLSCCHKSDQSAKSNYNSEEIEIAKSLNSEREEKKWTDEDMIRAFEKGNYATCNAFSALKVSDDNVKMYEAIKKEFIKSLKND